MSVLTWVLTWVQCGCCGHKEGRTRLDADPLTMPLHVWGYGLDADPLTMPLHVWGYGLDADPLTMPLHVWGYSLDADPLVVADLALMLGALPLRTVLQGGAVGTKGLHARRGCKGPLPCGVMAS